MNPLQGTEQEEGETPLESITNRIQPTLQPVLAQTIACSKSQVAFKEKPEIINRPKKKNIYISITFSMKTTKLTTAKNIKKNLPVVAPVAKMVNPYTL